MILTSVCWWNIPCKRWPAMAVCSAFPIHHTHYSIQSVSLAWDDESFLAGPRLALLVKVALAGLLFGWASRLFAWLSHAIKDYGQRFLPRPWLAPVLGAVLVLGISWALGTRDYLGLGVQAAEPGGVSIVGAFSPGGAQPLSWLWKLLLTAITLGMGFKGGEVTPLFFIGATLGNSLAVLLGAPVDLLAGLGFIAVFAGATNTPLACTLMGVELFGGEHVLYYALACWVAYYASGHSGIYSSQRVAVRKW
ncbi:MAG: hypothetical protein HC842_09195 [Cytophagales bacterium]|nr:hypothetical protein [Cytophagales bacterium]